MKFKLDENLPAEAVGVLREVGHDVQTARDQGLGGHSDDDLAGVCVREARALVTLHRC